MSDESSKPATPSRAATESSSAWSRFAFESALIVLSILLAFVLNEWREERRDGERVREARVRIASEVSHNMAALGSAIPYHQTLVANVTALLATEPLAVALLAG